MSPEENEKPGDYILLFCAETIVDHTGHDDKGPHGCGKAEVLPDGRLFVSLVDTNAGRTAAAKLKDDLLDVVL